jgi:hypothetical protein
MAERRSPAHVRAEIAAERERLRAAVGGLGADARRAGKLLGAGAGSLAGIGTVVRIAVALRRRRRSRR